MTYKLEFLPSALKEWGKLGHTVREQIKKKLAERLQSPKYRPTRCVTCRTTTKSSSRPLDIASSIESRTSGSL